MGGKGVAHAGNEEASGRIRYDVEVDQDHARALTEVCVIVKLVIVGIKHRAVAGGRVGRRDGGADDQRVARCDALTGIDRFATAETDRASALILLCHFLQFCHDGAGALALEDVACGNKFDLILFRGRGQLVLDKGQCERIGDQKGLFAKGFYEITQIEQLVFALNVLGRADKCFSHNKSP